MDEGVQGLVGPVAALGLHARRVVEALVRGDGASDDAVEVRADLVRPALLEGVAGGAFLGLSLTLGGSALARRTGSGSAGAAAAARTGGSGLFRSRKVITWNGGLVRGKQAAGDNVDADHEEERAENGARDLIGLDIHE